MRNVSCMLATGVTAKQAVRLRQALQKICSRRIQKSVFHKRAWILTKKPATGAGFCETGKVYLLFLMCLIKRLRLRIWFGVRVLRLLANGFSPSLNWIRIGVPITSSDLRK